MKINNTDTVKFHFTTGGIVDVNVTQITNTGVVIEVPNTDVLIRITGEGTDKIVDGPAKLDLDKMTLVSDKAAKPKRATEKKPTRSRGCSSLSDRI